MAMTSMESLDRAVNLALGRRQQLQRELKSLSARYHLKAMVRLLAVAELLDLLNERDGNDHVEQKQARDTS
jgi:hypothetical protein